MTVEETSPINMPDMFARAAAHVCHLGDTEILYHIIGTLPHIQRGEKKTGVFKKVSTLTVGDPATESFVLHLERNIIVVQHICRNVTLTTSRSTSTDVYTIMLRVAHLYAQLYPLDETYLAAAAEGLAAAYPYDNIWRGYA